ncbi:MAG: PriCT-2 domain-containing protein [Tannerella sp.]|jgi:hypothetical protein|nr:PriCT-2 domain-containing protein [Tannerella sp.]
MGNQTLNRIFSKAQVRENALQMYQNGLPKGFGIGLDEVDRIIRWETGRLSVITGVPNFGKSEFLDFMLVRLNRLYGWKTLFFSPENYPIGYHLQKLVSKTSGKPFDRNRLNIDEFNRSLDHIADNFFFLNYEAVETLDDILECAEQLIQEEKIKVLVIDPYNRLEHQRASNQTETEYISKLLDRLSNFAKRFDILIHLVAHPRKMSKNDGVFEVPNYYDINGSANFANKADYCLTVHRDKAAAITEIHVEKVKFKNLGCQGVAYLKYDIDTGNYYEEEHRELPFIDIPFPCRDEEDGQVQMEKGKNVLDVSVSCYSTVMNTEGRVINLYNFLKNRNESIDLETIRRQPDFKERKKMLPAITVSGVFGAGRKAENLLNHSGLICIDIDKKDQQRDMDAIFNELKQIENIAYLGRSCSGEGLFAIVPIKDPRQHLGHFLALEKSLAGRGIVIDTTCKEINRLRIYSHDPDAHYNLTAEQYTGLYTKPAREHHYYNTVIAIEDDKRLNDAIGDIQRNRLNLAEKYEDWRDLAIIFNNEFGEDGRKLFHAVSSQSSKYDEGECDEVYDRIGSYAYQEKSLGSFYYMYDEARKKLIG